MGGTATAVGGYVAGVHTADAVPDWLAGRDEACSPPSLPTSETDWSFPGHDRANTSRAPARAGPDWPLDRAWEFEWPAILDLPVVGLVATNGVAVALLPGPLGGAVAAVSLDDGRERWSRRVRDAEFGQVLAAGEIAFVEAEVPETGALFTAHALNDGTALWTGSRSTHAPRGLAGGRLLSFERNPDRSREETHFAATAVDARTGAECWRTVHPGRPFDVAVADGRALVSTGDGAVALDPASGEQQWRSGGDCDVDAVADGRMFSGGETLSACSVADGSREWQVRSERYRSEADGESRRPGFEVGAVTQSAVICRLHVHNDYPDRVQARNPASGDLLWDAGPEPRPVGRHSYSPPIVAGDDVLVVRYAEREDGENPPTALLRLDAATGAERDRVTFADEDVFAPVVADGLLVVPTRERLVAYA